MSSIQLFRNILGLFLFVSTYSFSQVKIFEFTGDVQTYVVPAGVSTISVDMYGASGGWNDYSGTMYEKYIPGNGGRLQASYPVYPGQTLYIYVGGKGEDAKSALGGSGGFNGGGNGNSSATYSGGGGGGASDIRIDGQSLENRILVVGGAGGAAYNYPDGGDNGGQGGDLIGADGLSGGTGENDFASCGKGGTQTQGGVGGQWSGYDKAEDGSFGKGGDGPAGTSGTGGGGGYYGGGGGCWSGGGGGSSFANNRAQNVKHEQGVNEGHGKVIITVNCMMPIVNVSGPTTMCQGQSITFTARSNFNGNMVWDKGIQNGVSFIPPAGKTIYTVSSSNPKECSYSVELNVGSGALKATTTNGIICEGETTTLIGYGGENYQWTGGVQNNVPFVPSVGVNNYTVRSSGAGSEGCGGEASVFVVVNKVQATADIQQSSPTGNGSINITPTGGTYPYTFIWKKDGMDFSKTEDISNLKTGSYEVIIVDAIGCSLTKTFTISGSTNSEVQTNSLSAEMSSDQQYLNISYGGYFEYKIQNDKGEIVLTGAVNNSGKIDLSRLPKGNYRISSLYNTTADVVNFVKR